VAGRWYGGEPSSNVVASTTVKKMLARLPMRYLTRRCFDNLTDSISNATFSHEFGHARIPGCRAR
jgi:hypothetical protein